MDDPTLLLAVVAALLVGGALGYLAAVVRGSRADRDLALRAARLEAQLAAEQRAGAERLAAEVEAGKRAEDRFRVLAADALAQTSEQFLGLAEQRLRATQVAGQADMQRREESVRALVDPITQTLGTLRAEVSAAERARLAGSASIGEQVRAMRESSEQLRHETGRLVTALRTSDVRGRWGETQLRRVVEAAGLLDRVDFDEQVHVRTDDGPLRPDMVIRLAGGKNVVVDAKTPLAAYLEACESDDPAVRTERLAAHARIVRRHVDELSGKRYWEHLAPTPEFVVLFVPAEPFLHAALEVDGGLVEHAFSKNVVIATPMTLLALLRTIAHAWREETLAENAQQVLTLGRELHTRLGTLSQHLGKLGRAIESAAGAYNQTVGSLDSRVLVTARKFRELGVTDAELPAPPAAAPQLAVLASRDDDAPGAVPGLDVRSLERESPTRGQP